MVVGLAVASCAAPQPLRETDAETMQAGAQISVEASETTPAGEVRPVYTVRSGDTLYSVAWRHGLDVRDLVAWNSLPDPDLILAGQTLYLAPDAGDAIVNRGADTGAPVAGPGVAPANEDAPDTPWRWPVAGPPMGGYAAGSGLGEGIGIGGELVTRILAAAPGEVVYAGRGLPLYGNLVIVRHDEAYLSAYGHNETLLVEEGDRVTQGQAIATMGMGPARRPQLHFEIRRDGVPVDPMDYLPR